MRGAPTAAKADTGTLNRAAFGKGTVEPKAEDRKEENKRPTYGRSGAGADTGFGLTRSGMGTQKAEETKAPSTASTTGAGVGAGASTGSFMRGTGAPTASATTSAKASDGDAWRVTTGATKKADTGAQSSAPQRGTGNAPSRGGFTNSGASRPQTNAGGSDWRKK